MNAQGTVHTEQPTLPILTAEERERAAQWLMDNAPYAFNRQDESSGYFAAVRTLRNGEY